MNEPSLRKKDFINDKSIRKQKRVLIFAILCSITLFLSSSYALLTNFDKTDNVISFKTGNLNMTVNNTLVNLNGNIPENDESGLTNATPISLTLTNTGTMFVDGYEVKLISDEAKTSTLDEKYIKYAISEDGTTYSKPNILTENNNIIFTGYDLEVDASKTIYLKVWIDEVAGNNALNKEYYGSIKIELYQEKNLTTSIQNSIKNSKCNPTVVEDGITYLSGSNDCINFNYVWYSGKLWRIASVNSDGSLKMVTEDLMTTLNWGATPAYSTSYVTEWLNQEFLPTLYNYENIIVTDAGWYSIADSGTPPTKPTGNYTLFGPIGLLNAYEYYLSYNKATENTGYLNIGYYWWTMTPYDDSAVVRITNEGIFNNGKSTNSGNGIRPSVVLMSTTQLIGGDGTYENPYRIEGDKDKVTNNTTLLNTRTSGEYVTLENDETNQVFRIIGTETVGDNLTTKLVLNDYVRDRNDVDSNGNTTEPLKKYFSGSEVLWSDIDKTDSTYWRGYLNNVWIQEIDNTYNTETKTSNILDKGTYYLGSWINENYKSTVCSTVSSEVSIEDCIKNGEVVSNKVDEDYVGLLRFGEMFATQINDYTASNAIDVWTLTPTQTQVVRNRLYATYNSLVPNSSPLGGHPSINLKDTIVIKSGTGTKQSPYVVGLPS